LHLINFAVICKLFEKVDNPALTARGIIASELIICLRVHFLFGIIKFLGLRTTILAMTSLSYVQRRQQ
jgi:hypothetical protein